MCSVQVWYSVVLVILLRESYVKGSTQWPGGEYVLLKPKTGCPNNWKDKAWILQDTKTYGSNNRSRILHIDGYVTPRYVVRSFCIRTGKEGSSAWPQGQYCIYVPKTFSSGSIKMAGEHNNDKDAVKYTSSFVDYNDKTSNKQKKHIKFHFQCKTSGNKKIPISLPITKPFYLLPYGSRDCQQVKWMVATKEWIKYRTENAMKGTVPAYQLENNNGIITMFYCYYKSCNYTLTDKKGVFQSPGFPGKYPDGQLCSWRIMVPVNHTLQVRFTNVSLNDNDTLRYSERYSTRSNGSFRSWHTIPLHSTVPFSLSADSDVLFVFSSDESKTSSRFRAEYRVSIPQALTTPTEIPTMSPDTTTIVSTTSWSAPGDSTQWPGGEYVLIKPKNGCPTKWKDKAWILQDTKSKGSNYRSRILHIDGYVASYYVVRSFCIRTGTEVSSVWPQGQYCIYGPKSSSSGSIKVTGDHDYNKDAVKYTSSFVDYNDETSNGQKKHIKFYFQCYTRGNKKIPISLPITKPFYLLPYGSRDCQQVKWMVSKTEWITYETKNTMRGTVPAYQLENNNGTKMFYCYYKSCNYTLTDKEGVYQSPGFPGKYPDGQLCSWRIMVPVNHTLQVRFTSFSLNDNDTLRYSERYSTRSNGSFRSWHTIPLHSTVPFSLSADSDVLFVFSSDESKTSSGFRAEYRVSIPQALTTPTEIPTMSTDTTTMASTTSWSAPSVIFLKRN